MISFRDPAGALCQAGNRILRIVATGAPDLQAFLSSKAGRKYLDSGRVAQTTVLTDEQAAEVLANPEIGEAYGDLQGQLLVEHERIPFPNYPYEWPAEMLHAAGALTLDLAEDLRREGLGLKDATPLNILFHGTEPVFVDLLSFELRDPHDPTWLPYAQFARTFLLPLLAYKYFGLRLDQTLGARRDGIEPEEMYRYLSPVRRLAPPFLTLVSIPTWLGRRHSEDDNSIYRKKLLDDPEKAGFILDALWHRLGRTLHRLAPPAGRQSVWSGYMNSEGNNYATEQFAAKESFLSAALPELAPRSVLDVGCNTGHFSLMAARTGAGVVAIDADPVVVGHVWRQARPEHLDILPLVVNLARPSPGVGWRNEECPSFLDRARGKFDVVLMLAVLHHMLVTDRVPLASILELAAELTRDALMIEFIEPQDSMFRRLTRGREELHKDLTVQSFEHACLQRFHIVRSERIPGAARTLYLLRKK